MKAYNLNFLGRIHENKNIDYKYISPMNAIKGIKEKDEINSCPMCGDNHYIVVGNFQIKSIIDMWVNNYGFNPIADIYKDEILEKRYCSNCGLFFYNYHLPDTKEMYNELSNKISYYPEFRPEYGIATEIIEELKPESLLEIGCGNGSFLKRIEHLIPNVLGSEYNPDALNICKSKGLNVSEQKIYEMKEESFDVICHFEVLEHVFDTFEFMNQSLKLLKKGGKLIIGTPDPEGISSIIGRFQLNLPPHHQFDFSKKSLEWLASKFGLKVYQYQKTELDYHHYARYVKVLTGKELLAPDMVGFYNTKDLYSGTSHVIVFEKV